MLFINKQHLGKTAPRIFNTETNALFNWSWYIRNYTQMTKLSHFSSGKLHKFKWDNLEYLQLLDLEYVELWINIKSN